MLSGFEVLEWITRHTFDPPLRISVLSGSDQVADMERARELGVGDYIVKPISSEDLMVRLNRVLSPAPLATNPIAAGCLSTLRKLGARYILALASSILPKLLASLRARRQTSATKPIIT